MNRDDSKQTNTTSKEKKANQTTTHNTRNRRTVFVTPVENINNTTAIKHANTDSRNHCRKRRVTKRRDNLSRNRPQQLETISEELMNGFTKGALVNVSPLMLGASQGYYTNATGDRDDVKNKDRSRESEGGHPSFCSPREEVPGLYYQMTHPAMVQLDASSFSLAVEDSNSAALLQHLRDGKDRAVKKRIKLTSCTKTTNCAETTSVSPVALPRNQNQMKRERRKTNRKSKLISFKRKSSTSQYKVKKALCTENEP